MSTTFTADPTIKASGSSSFLISKTATTDRGTRCCRAFPVIAGEIYSVKVRVRGGAAAASGVTLRMSEAATLPASGYVSSSAEISHTDLLANGPVTNTFNTFEYTYSVPGGVFYVSFVVINDNGGPLALYFDDCSAGRQITASFLAANSIAVGSAAIQNGAIVNAMIGLAAIDDARIANLSASKLSVGTGIIGGNLKSSNYSAGSAGWILQPGGFAEFGAAVIRDQLVSSQIAAGAITAAKISVTDLASINATLGTITSGTISTGSMLLTSGGNIRQGSTAYNTGVGFWLGDVSGTPKFSLGDPAANHITWDGTSLTIAGVLSAATGTFAGSLSAATGTFAGTLTTSALTVAGNGIFSSSAATSTTTQILNTFMNTELTSGSVNPGATGVVLISAHCEYLNGNSTSGGGEDGIYTTYVTPLFAIYRDTGNVQLTSWTPVIGVGSAERQVTLEFVTDTPGAASTYSLRVQSPSVGLGSYGKVFRRSILVQGINK